MTEFDVHLITISRFPLPSPRVSASASACACACVSVCVFYLCLHVCVCVLVGMVAAPPQPVRRGGKSKQQATQNKHQQGLQNTQQQQQHQHTRRHNGDESYCGWSPMRWIVSGRFQRGLWPMCALTTHVGVACEWRVVCGVLLL